MKIDPKPVDCAAVLQVLAERYLEEEKRGGTPDYAIALEYGADLLKRETLVREVIRCQAFYQALSPTASLSSEHYRVWTKAAEAVLDAVRELADWSPT